MIVKLHEVSERFSEHQFRLARLNFPKLDSRLSFDWIDCKAQLAKSNETVSLHGKYRVDLRTNCDFCLSAITVEMDREFNLDLVAEDSWFEPEKDLEITRRSPEVEFYQGQDIVLPRYFEDQLLLDLPMSVACSQECKGICSVCGVNRNHEDCQCAEESSSNPFSILSGLKS